MGVIETLSRYGPADGFCERCFPRVPRELANQRPISFGLLLSRQTPDLGKIWRSTRPSIFRSWTMQSRHTAQAVYSGSGQANLTQIARRRGLLCRSMGLATNPVQRRHDTSQCRLPQTWTLLQQSLPAWKWPEPPKEEKPVESGLDGDGEKPNQVRFTGKLFTTGTTQIVYDNVKFYLIQPYGCH